MSPGINNVVMGLAMAQQLLRPLRYDRSYLGIKLMSKVIMSYSIQLSSQLVLFTLQLLFGGVCYIVHQLVVM
jgi:hypothetical protein